MEYAYDYDGCCYKISRTEGSNILKFGFSCHCTQKIMENGGKEMLDELYPEYKVPDSEKLEGADITLGINMDVIPKTHKLKKTMSE